MLTSNQCTWGAECFGCGGCNPMTQCGKSCPAGYHPTSYSCNFNCGVSCIYGNNQATCVQN
ncbi:MAG: hypothetical protein FJ109_05070 [Deltaproteobacteria bacterium]|nr:hypothetical protein [Deltaproteobacteria bacterium]